MCSGDEPWRRVSFPVAVSGAIAEGSCLSSIFQGLFPKQFEDEEEGLGCVLKRTLTLLQERLKKLGLHHRLPFKQDLPLGQRVFLLPDHDVFKRNVGHFPLLEVEPAAVAHEPADLREIILDLL